MTIAWHIFEISVIALEVFLDLYLFTNVFPAKKAHRQPCTFITAAAYFSWLCFTHYHSVPYSVEFGVVFFICALYLLICRSGMWMTKMFWIAFANAVFASLAYALTRLLTYLSDARVVYFYEQNGYRFASVTIAHILYILFVLFALRVCVYKHEGSVSNLVAMTGLSLSNIIVVLLIEYVNAIDQGTQWQVISVVAAVGTLGVNLLTLWLFQRLTKQEHEVNTLRSIAYHNELQEKYISELGFLYQEIRKWQHDSVHHMEAMNQALLRAGTCTEVQEYIRAYRESVSVPDEFVSTPNLMLNALLSAKYRRAKQHSIRVLSQVVMPSNLQITDIHLCTLLGNLLDNAIEACESLNPALRFIDVQILPTGNNLCIKIENAVHCVIEPSNLVSPKKDAYHHGIGLKSITAIVEEYGGFYERYIEAGMFTTRILLPPNTGEQEGGD